MVVLANEAEKKDLPVGVDDVEKKNGEVRIDAEEGGEEDSEEEGEEDSNDEEIGVVGLQHPIQTHTSPEPCVKTNYLDLLRI